MFQITFHGTVDELKWRVGTIVLFSLLIGVTFGVATYALKVQNAERTGFEFAIDERKEEFAITADAMAIVQSRTPFYLRSERMKVGIPAEQLTYRDAGGKEKEVYLSLPLYSATWYVDGRGTAKVSLNFPKDKNGTAVIRKSPRGRGAAGAAATMVGIFAAAGFFFLAGKFYNLKPYDAEPEW